jgi:hypothetical protein
MGRQLSVCRVPPNITSTTQHLASRRLTTQSSHDFRINAAPCSQSTVNRSRVGMGRRPACLSRKELRSRTSKVCRTELSPTSVWLRQQECSFRFDSIGFKLALSMSSQETLFAGPSNEGLSEPIQCTSYSLIFATGELIDTASLDERAIECVLRRWHEMLKAELIEAEVAFRRRGVTLTNAPGAWPVASLLLWKTSQQHRLFHAFLASAFQRCGAARTRVSKPTPGRTRAMFEGRCASVHMGGFGVKAGSSPSCRTSDMCASNALRRFAAQRISLARWGAVVSRQIERASCAIHSDPSQLAVRRAVLLVFSADSLRWMLMPSMRRAR